MKIFVETICRCGEAIQSLKQLPLTRMECGSCGKKYEVSFDRPEKTLDAVGIVD